MDRMDTALQAAWEAGDILLERFALPKQTSMKGLRDMVTDADFAAQAAIVATLRRVFPEDGVLAEEAGVDLPTDPAEGRVWVIDPLDGTTNYSRQFPAFGVSIGLVEAGVPILGVVHYPLRHQTFIAERGHGAHLLSDDADPAPMHVTATPRLADAVVGLDWSHANEIREQTLAALRPVALACRTVRTLGSAALGLAAVAAGWLDGYFHFSLQPWDTAAGAALVLEAGGRLAQPDGSPWTFGQPQLVASNAAIHAELIQTMGEPTTK